MDEWIYDDRPSLPAAEEISGFTDGDRENQSDS